MKDLVSGYVKSVDILHKVNIKAKKAKITVIIGPNGCGKTTLLKTIYGFVKTKQGSILYNGKDITGLDPHKLIKLGIAYVLQQRSVFPFLSVHDNLKLGAWSGLGRKKQTETEKAIEEAYKRFPNLKRRKKVMAGLMSGGEQRMLEVARALIIHPQIILLDEPSAGLAPKIVVELYEKLRMLKEEKVTFVLVDQNVRAAVSIADYIYVMKMGQITSEGSKATFDKDLKKIVESWLRI